MPREVKLGARSRESGAETAPYRGERRSRTSAFRVDAGGFPLKSRYSGRVWGGEDIQGNRMFVTGTPGRRALRGRVGAILASFRVPGVELAATGRRVRRVDYECPLSAVPDVQPSAVSIQVMPFVCPE